MPGQEPCQEIVAEFVAATLTAFRLRLLRHIYEQKGSHIRDLSTSLGLHLHSVHKAIERLMPLLQQTRVGATKLLELDPHQGGYLMLLLIIEDYRSDTAPGEAKTILRNLANALAGDRNVLAACLFGSHARGRATGKSDIDILVVLRKKEPALARRLAELGALFGREVSPLVLTETEFLRGIKEGEPTLLSLREPRQRYIVRGAEYFLSRLAPLTR